MALIHLLVRLSAAIDRLPRPVILLLSLLLVAALGFFDAITGADLSFLVFYLIPVGFAAWYGGRRLAVANALVSTLAWVLADAWESTNQFHPLVSAWNVAMKLGFLLFAGLVLTALRHAYDVQRSLARTDPLTGASNRRAFLDATEAEIHRCVRYRHPLTLAYFDVDNFKAVNDRLGHAEGDRVLKAVVDALNATLRETDLLGRMGGDEFAVLLPESATDMALPVIEKCREALRQTAARNSWPVTFSFGVISGTAQPVSAPDLLCQADGLLYQAKQAGKDCVRSGTLNTVPGEAAAR
jgi:diguanylate cyclase (GGDEF)-like protein